MLKDLDWFREFATKFNSVVLLPSAPRVTWPIECDATLTAAGRHSPVAFFAAPFSPEIVALVLPITQLEVLALLHAVSALLPANPRNFIILISTDNLASQQVLSSGKGKEPLLFACARQLWLISAINNCELEIKHKPGADLVLADALSRSLNHPSMKSKADNLCACHC